MSESAKRKSRGRVETIDLSDSDSVQESPSSATKKPHRDSDGEVVFLDSDSNDNVQPMATTVEESEPAKQDRLVKEFILITKTDSKLANYFLEQHNWQLQVRLMIFN